MVYKIPIKNTPNQELTTSIGNVFYKIDLRTIQENTYMSVWANGEPLFYSQLCVPNEYVNPYNYLSTNGKFYFSCLDNEYPFFKAFNNTQELLFFTTDEVNNA